ncbi:hypothetical protein LVJ83_02715 [Uruburuella testudinis]|uniref:Glycosyl transferase family 2 n=1 Tax=Uruburuella testudinis TaxID=1282863 RepID=A0ABY4DU69_9NEIS|nr:hypothetical protein [Uruburuella testudinis]UOO82406.1 hypothetical protein LVJ83_02715 [Uruburuella testudinis]
MHDLAVVIATVCRKSLLRAVDSIFQQDFTGRIQILIGVDKDLGGNEQKIKAQLQKKCPPNCSLFWLNPGYSTSKRHGGVHRCCYGGSLRSVLSFLADAPLVMYLDDDDWFDSQHCRLTVESLQGRAWAFSHCIYADGNKNQGLCVDLLESVGPGKGIYVQDFGGFVRPSGLLLDKIKCLHILHLWADSPNENGDAEDRLVFNQLKQMPYGFTGQATVFYTLDPADGMHHARLDYIREQGADFKSVDKIGTVREHKSTASIAWRRIKSKYKKSK